MRINWDTIYPVLSRSYVDVKNKWKSITKSKTLLQNKTNNFTTKEDKIILNEKIKWLKSRKRKSLWLSLSATLNKPASSIILRWLLLKETQKDRTFIKPIYSSYVSGNDQKRFTKEMVILYHYSENSSYYYYCYYY